MADFSPTIGRIGGIKIELHWTFILLLLFILFLSLYFFLIWVLLFVCVLAHELVHSITSKRNGIKVNKIVLYPFGGGSIINFENVSPEIEFRISIVGPIASLLIAVGVGMLNIFTPPGTINTTLQLLFMLNVFLGVFNLLPWLPLDGGRALRSYLQKTRDFFSATKIAVRSSNIITALFIAGTIVYAILIQGYSLLYREFIVVIDIAVAFFIYSGAQAELQSAFIRQNIADLKASDAMTNNFVLVNGDSDIKSLYRTLMSNKTHIAVFQKEGKVQVLSNYSLQKLLSKPVPNGRIEDYGTPIPSVPYTTLLYTSIERMRSENSNIAAVTMKGKVKGILLMQHVESIIALHISQKRQAAGRKHIDIIKKGNWRIPKAK